MTGLMKKLMKWSTAVALLIGFFIASSFIYYKIKDYYESIPRVVTEINGIKLGERKSDTLFRHSGFEIRAQKDQSKRPAGEEFFNNSTKTWIEFENNLVDVIRQSCESAASYTKVNGISCGDNGEQVIEKYKDSLRIQCLKETEHDEAISYRVYDAPKYGIRYLLKNNLVVGFVVTSPEKILIWAGKSWVPCN